MPQLSKEDHELAPKLRSMARSNSPHEARTARKKLADMARRYGISEDELEELSQTPAPAKQLPNPLDLIRVVLEQHVSCSEDYATAMCLWAGHCFIYQRFKVTPRLFLTSPVAGCGKSTVLQLLERVTPNGEMVGGCSDAVLYRLLDQQPTPVLLLDEGDNADLPNRPVARRVLNNGHLRGATERRFINGKVTTFQIFAPLALAAIKRLHLPLMSRSITISLARSPVLMPDFDAEDALLPHIFLVARDFFRDSIGRLGLDPEFPPGFMTRLRDNWKPLLAVADLCGGTWPALARKAALAFSKATHDRDQEITCIRHCLDVFERHGRAGHYLGTVELLAGLHAMENAPWSEWCGLKGNRGRAPDDPARPRAAAGAVRYPPQDSRPARPPPW